MTTAQRLARRYTRCPATADDIAQEAEIAAWRYASSHDGRPGDGWLRTIVKREAQDILKRRHVSLESEPSARQTPDLERLISIPLQRMGGYGKLLTLVYIDGLTIKEAAKRLGRPYSTTKRDIPRALEQLRIWSEYLCN